MDPSGNILQTRFLLNMSRIHGLLRVTRLDYEELKPSAGFQSEGIRADILRSAVVFLHATFEDVVRSRIPRRKQDDARFRRIDPALTNLQLGHSDGNQSPAISWVASERVPAVIKVRASVIL